jgi:hypothetical protein
MTKVISFCAGPSAGKTTNALGLAAYLKELRKDVLYVPEFAMQAVVQGRKQTLDDQLYVFAKQANKLYDAKDQFEFIVTDCPIFMMLHYLESGQSKFTGRNEKYWKLTLADLIMQTFEMYDNLVYFIDRGDREFRQVGRLQNEQESKEIDKHILNILALQGIEYRKIANWQEVLSDIAL